MAAEDENSFAKITGSTSFGILKSFPTGVNADTSRSNAPEVLKIWTARKSAISVGAISRTTLNPS